MGLSEDLRTALAARVGTVTGIPGADYRAGENTVFEPPIGETWLRETLVFGARTRLTAPADGAWLQHTGLYLVDVFHPENLGPGAADTLADAVLTQFADGQQYTTPSGSLRITRATRRGGFRAEGWYQVPVEIGWEIETVQTVM